MFNSAPQLRLDCYLGFCYRDYLSKLGRALGSAVIIWWWSFDCSLNVFDHNKKKNIYIFLSLWGEIGSYIGHLFSVFFCLISSGEQVLGFVVYKGTSCQEKLPKMVVCIKERWLISQTDKSKSCLKKKNAARSQTTASWDKMCLFFLSQGLAFSDSTRKNKIFLSGLYTEDL